MNINEKLQIILITYNRQKHVAKTLEQLLSEKSPVRTYDLLVLDNNSTDITANFVSEMQKKYSNIKYQKNKYNLGIAGNIAKAMELASKEYVWIICDDDIYDWSSWAEVEQAINNNEKLICVARYAMNDDEKTDIAHQLMQMSFVPAIIYNTSLLNDSTMRNSFDNIFTLFPHLVPIVHYINNGNKIYVVDKGIVANGMNIETTDCSYVRGNNISVLCQRTKTMTWIVGYANICSMIKDVKLKHQAMICAIDYIHGNFKQFVNHMLCLYFDEENRMQFLDVYSQLDTKNKIRLLSSFILKKLFSMRTENRNILVIRFFGIKIKFNKYYEGDFAVIKFLGLKIKKKVNK